MDFLLDYMTWEDFKEGLADFEVAIIPTGSCEQHGPNQTFATDTIRAKEVARLVAEKLAPKAVVCPTIPYGISPHHMEFPGTMTLKVDTYINILTDLATSMKAHGINKVVFINGHGGNTHSIGAVCSKLYHEHGMRCGFTQAGSELVSDYWDEKDFSKVRGHACESEVSQSLYLDKRIVKEDRLTPGKVLDPRFGESIPWAEVFWPFHEVTENGALGDATKAKVEYGEEVTKIIVEKIAEYIKEYFL